MLDSGDIKRPIPLTKLEKHSDVIIVHFQDVFNVQKLDLCVYLAQLYRILQRLLLDESCPVEWLNGEMMMIVLGACRGSFFLAKWVSSSSYVAYKSSLEQQDSSSHSANQVKHLVGRCRSHQKSGIRSWEDVIG